MDVDNSGKINFYVRDCNVRNDKNGSKISIKNKSESLLNSSKIITKSHKRG